MRVLAALISFGRLIFGVAFIARPKLMDRAWIGKQAGLPGTQVLARAVGPGSRGVIPLIFYEWLADRP